MVKLVIQVFLKQLNEFMASSVKSFWRACENNVYKRNRNKKEKQIKKTYGESWSASFGRLFD